MTSHDANRLLHAAVLVLLVWMTMAMRANAQCDPGPNTHLWFTKTGGYSGSQVETPATGMVSALADFTFEWWMDLRDGGAYAMVLQQEIACGSGWKRTISLGAHQGRLHFLLNSVNGGGSNQVGALGTTPLYATGWRHIAIRRVGSQITAFVDGVEETWEYFYGPSGAPFFAMVEPVRIGGSTCGSYFTGGVDEVRIWNYGRSKEQIAHYQDNQVSGTEAGLLAYWRFDDAGGSLAHNSASATGSALHGILKGLNGPAPAWVLAPEQQAPMASYCASGLGSVVIGNDKSALPMKGVHVQLIPPVGHAFEVITKDDGTFASPDLPAGHYRVRASISYVEPATGESVEIVNYPNWRSDQYHWLDGAVGSKLVVQYPWPVVLQGGHWGSAAATWDFLRAYLEGIPEATATLPGTTQTKGQVGLPAMLCFPMPKKNEKGHGTAGYVNSGGSLDDYVKNAEKLRAWINGPVFSELSQWLTPEALVTLRIHLVGHSMGGVIARTYRRSGYTPPAASSISFDAIHGGTTKFVHGKFKSGLWAGSLNGVLYEPYRGTAPTAEDFAIDSWNQNFVEAYSLQHLLYSAVSSTIVQPGNSAFGWGEAMYPLALPTITPKVTVGWAPSGWIGKWTGGHECAVSGLSHSKIKEDLATSYWSNRFLATGEPPPIQLGTAFLPLGSSEPASAPTGLQGFLAAAAGSSVTESIWFDSVNGIDVTLVIEGEGATAYLSQAGSELPKAGLEVEEPGMAAVIESFQLPFPAPGQVVLTALAGPAESATVEYALHFDNDRGFSLDVNPAQPGGGVPVQLRGMIADGNQVMVPTGPSAVRARVQLPDGTMAIVPLFDDGLHGDGDAGDGIFGNMFADTWQEGRYIIEARGTISVGKEVVDRSGFQAFAVLPTGAMIVGSPSESLPDSTGDGKADALVIGVSVQLVQNGAYRAVARLEDAFGQQIALASKNFDNATGAGTYLVELEFPGPTIVAHGVPGPWTVRGIIVFDMGAGALPASTAPDYLTSAWQLEDFDAPPGPGILMLMPSTGPLIGNNEVTVMGSGFTQATSVTVGNTEVGFEILNDNALRIVMPPVVLALKERAPSVGGGLSPAPALTSVATSSSGIPPLPGGSLPPQVVVVDVVVTTLWGATVKAGGYTYSVN